MAEPGSKTAAEARDVLTRCPLPVALLDLHTLQVVDANAAGALVIGRDLPIVEPIELETLLTPEDAKNAAHALNLVAEGTIHAYEANRKVLRADGVVVDGHVWVRSLAHFRDAMALVVFMAADTGVSPESAGDTASIALPSMRISFTDPIAVGSMAIDTRIIRVSAEIEKLLGERPAALRDTMIVNRLHPDDVATFLLALGRALDDGASVGLHVRVRRRRGDYGSMRMLVSPAANSASTRLGFVLTRNPRRRPPTMIESPVWNSTSGASRSRCRPRVSPRECMGSQTLPRFRAPRSSRRASGRSSPCCCAETAFPASLARST
jgi:hypothetical protein